MAGRSPTVDVVSAEASGYLLEVGGDVYHRSVGSELQGNVQLTEHPEFGELFFRDPKPEELASFRSWLRENPNTTLVLYHGTSTRLPIESEGLKPTTARTAKSLQTRRGYVSLSVYPGMAKTFGKMAYPQENITVWAVQVPVSKLVPDTDQLRNIRMWKKLNVPGDLTSSLVYGHGAQVRGQIEPARLSKVAEDCGSFGLAITEAQDWTQLKPTGDIQKDLLNFYELEYKYSTIASGRIRMSPRRREVILEGMEKQAKALGAAIAEAALPTFDSWIRAHDLEHLDVMGAERMRKLQKLYHAKGKTGNVNDWVLKQRTTGVSMGVVTPEEWLRAVAGDEAPALRFALELLHEEEYASQGDFDWFVRKVVARDSIGTMRRAIQQVDPGEQEAVVLQMFQTVYPIGYRKRLGETSAKVGRNITSADQVLKSVEAGHVDPPELFAKVNWAINVVHQAGTMAYHVADDMGISVQYLTKLSNLDTSAWDEDLRAMEVRQEPEADDIGSVAESAATYLAEAVGHGEWWIDGSGMVQFADGDVGDRGHQVLAMETMLADADFDVDDPNAPEIYPMEPLSDEAKEYLRERSVDPKVLEFLSVGGDPREWMVEHRGWIRLIGSGAELWEWDQGTVDLLRGGVFDAWGLDVDKIGDEDYVLVEEAKTRDLFQVPMKALMNDRYDAAALRRLAKEGAPKRAPADEFMKAAWARKAAGERGVGEAVDDDPIDWGDEPNDVEPFDWDDWFDTVDKLPGLKRMPAGGSYGPQITLPRRPRPDFEADWEIKGKLARTSRPGYPTRTTVPVEKVDKWIAGAKKAGIRSIIVLLGPDQLGMYKDVPGGLVEYYRSNGFDVVHLPTIDKHRVFIKAKTKVPKGTRWLDEVDLGAAYEAYRGLPKPVLVHCSAGLDRSGAVVQYIKDREQGKTESVDLTMNSAAASTYLLEQLGKFEYEVPDDKEQQLYDFYMMTYMPDPAALTTSGTVKPSKKAKAAGAKPRFRKERPDLAMAVDDTRKKLVPYLKSNLLNAAFYSISCEARYIFSKTGGSADDIINEVEKKFGEDMAIRVRNYWKEYQHLRKYPVSKGKSFEAPGVVPSVMGSDAQSDRNASYRAVLIAFEGQVQNFVKFASWGFWDRPWSGYNKKAFVKAMKDNNVNGMKAASGSYGGGNWGRIADGWLKLWASKGIKDEIIFIDHLYSIQHNTGAMLNKVQSYMKNGRYSWLDRALDKKFGAESPYEFAKRVSPGMRQLAMPVMKSWYGTTLEQWAKENPTKAAAEAKKASGEAHVGTHAGAMGDGTKKDYVRTKTFTLRPAMKKALLRWYKDVTPENVDEIFAAAEKKHGIGEMKKWQFPAGAKTPGTKAKSSPPMVQGQNAPLVQVLNGVLGTTEKHQYFDKKKPGTSWMSAKHLGIKPELTHFRKETAAPPKPPKPPTPPPKPKAKAKVKVKVSPGLQVPLPSAIAKMGFPEPKGPPVDVSGIKQAIQKQVATPIDDVYMEVQQPESKIPAIKGIRQTYQMGLKDAKSVVDFADNKKIAPEGVDSEKGYLKFWWPKGNFVTLGDDVAQHPQAHWGEAQIAYARFSAGKWVFMRSGTPVKMIMVDNRWYVPATRVMEPSMVEHNAADAPKLGAQMAQVVMLAAGQNKEMAELLQKTFNVDPHVAKSAVDDIPTAKLADIGWTNYSLGTTAFAPNKFAKQAPVNVAVWSDKAKAVVPVEMAAWRMTAHDIPYEFFVMNETIDAARKAVEEAPVPVEPVEVHEGKMMYTVHDHGMGNAKLFGPSGDAGAVGDKAVELGKEYPNAGINEYIYLDGQWQLLRQYNRVWHVLNTNDSVMNKIKAKTGAKPIEPGVMAPSPKPEDVGVHFKIRAYNPETEEMEYVFGNEFVSWNQVEKGVAALQDPGSGIKGAPFSDVKVTIEKWAHPKAWPWGAAAKTEPALVETMKAVPSKTEKGKYTALITFVDREWEKALEKPEPKPVAIFTGPFPKDRAQAVAWAKGEMAAREPVDNPVVTFTVRAKSDKTHPPGKSVPVFANAFTHWNQVEQGLKAMKDPDSGIAGAPIADEDILIQKWAHPIAWPPDVDVSKYRLDTSKPIKVEEFKVEGDVKWEHPAWSKVVEEMKAPGKSWAFGAVPATRAGALQWSKIATAMQEEPVEKVLPPEQATMTVADALMLLPDIKYETSVALNVHPDDAILADVWDQLSMDNQSDIQIAIGRASAEALKKKQADIYKVYPTVRDDVFYVVKSGIAGGPEGIKKTPVGKSPESAMFAVTVTTSKPDKGPVTIVKQVEVTKGVFRDLHEFNSSGALVDNDKAWLDPKALKNKHTGLKHEVPHKFVFVDSDGEVTDLESPNFPVALEQANVLEAELSGDEFGVMHLSVHKSFFFKITGRIIEGDDIWPVEYGLPEGYIKSANTQWAAATGLEVPPEIPAEKPEPKKDIWADLDAMLVGDVLNTLSLSDEAKEDLFQNAQSGDTMGNVWDSITDHTMTEVNSAWRKHWKKALPPKEKPWNAWTVQEAIQLPVQPEAKAELKKHGGGMVLGEVMGELSEPVRKDIMAAILDWQVGKKPEVEEPKKEPKKWKVEKPAEGTPTTELTFGQVKMFLGTSMNAQDALDTAQGLMAKTDSDTIGSVWSVMEIDYKQDIALAYDDWKIEQAKVPQEKKAPKGKIEEPTLDSPIANLTLSQVIKFLNVSEDTRDKLSALQGVVVPPHQLIVDNVWDELSANERADIMSAHSDWKIEKMKVSQEKPEELKAYSIPSAKLGSMAPAEVAAKIPTNAKTSTVLTYGNASSFDDLYGAWEVLTDDAKRNILQAWEKIEGGKIAKAKLKKKVSKKKAPKAPTVKGAMKALQSWTVADVMEFMELFAFTVQDLRTVTIAPKKQSVMSVWSLLDKESQDNIVAAWIVHKKTKQAEPKKPKKKGKKAPTTAQAEKNVKTWKLASVFEFLDPKVHDGVVAAQSMTGKHLNTHKVAEVWDAMTTSSQNNLVAAYVEFMKKKHGLESVSAEASCYLLEAKQKRAYPRITRRVDYGAEGGRDLYFVQFREDGREYCYALGVAIRADIERIESFSLAKAASIVKARSSGEYDCKTGELKHVEPKPKKMRKRRRRKKVEPPPGPEQVQTRLFDESVEASMYLLEAVVVDTAYRSELPPILEAVDDPDAAAVAVEVPRRGMHPQDKKVRRELQSSEYPATAEKDKAFVFHWADGRGICAFKHKKDAVAWINDDVNSPNGPEIVKWWYGDPYTKQYDSRQKGKKKRKRLRVATSYAPAKPKKGRKIEALRAVDTIGWLLPDGTWVGSPWGHLEGLMQWTGIKDEDEALDYAQSQGWVRIQGWDTIEIPSTAVGSFRQVRDKAYELWTAVGSPQRAVSVEVRSRSGTSRFFEVPATEFFSASSLADLRRLSWFHRGREPVRRNRRTEAARKRRPPETYMSIGHRTKNRQAWYMLRGSDDVTYGEPGSTHAKLGKDFSHADVFGRVDHDARRVSVWDSGTGRSDYAISILRMDFPGYEVWLSRAGHPPVRVPERKTEDVDRDVEADRMLDRYREEPTSIWLYTDMPVKDRVAWAYLAADRFKGVEGEDLVERFIETLRRVVDDPETFWQQIREKGTIRANYLDHLDWDIETVDLKDVGVYPRFSGFSSEVCQGSVLDTAEAIETTGELPEKVAKLREMSDVWMTILKFLPPILVPGGILRSEERGYDVLKWTCDDGNHRLVSAAMAGATEAVCFVGTQKKEKIEPARLIMPGQAESVNETRVQGVLTPGGGRVPMFKNPTEKELFSIVRGYPLASDRIVRAFIMPNGDAYVFDAYSLLHDWAARSLPNIGRAVPVELWFDMEEGEVSVRVTDFSRRTAWHHNPDTADVIRGSHWITTTFPGGIYDIDYYDDSVVGDWEELQPEEQGVIEVVT